MSEGSVKQETDNEEGAESEPAQITASYQDIWQKIDGLTCSPLRLHSQSDSFTMPQPHMQSQEGFLCLPAQSQECIRNGLLHKDTWTGLQTGINPATRPVSALLCKEETEEHCQSPKK